MKNKILLLHYCLHQCKHKLKVWFDTDLMIGMPDKTPVRLMTNYLDYGFEAASN
jgi:hypothetical protein